MWEQLYNRDATFTMFREMRRDSGSIVNERRDTRCPEGRRLALRTYVVAAELTGMDTNRHTT